MNVAFKSMTLGLLGSNKLLLVFIVLVLQLGCIAQIVTIPDANFKSYLIGNKSINTNGDAEIQTSEASVFAGHINVSSLNISDLTGLAAFTSLTVLNCFNNNLTTLNVSANVNLQSLYCNNNQLVTLNLSNKPNLFQLQCNNNNLTNITLTNCVKLRYVYAQNNDLTTLNLAGLSNLAILFCGSNDLASLDVSGNSNLVELNIEKNQISTMNVSNCAKLEVYDLSDNNFSIVNVETNPKLIRFDCSNNSLTELSMKNGFNHKLKLFDAKSNPNLTCIEIDNLNWANTNLTNGKDASANFSQLCP